MPTGWWSRLSLPVGWTGATHCTTASLMSSHNVCSRCRMLRPGWSPAHDDLTTSHQCFASCTGRLPVCQLQDRHACSSVSVRPCPKLPGWRLPTRHRRWHQTIAFCWHLNTGHRSYTKFFWRQNIRCSSTSALEQSAFWHKTTWLGPWSV